MTKIKGWKNINKDMTCRNFKFKVGKTYKHKGDIELCKEGFHFHENSLDIYKYYDNRDNCLVAEIEASGKVITGDDKSVCSEIEIIRILDNEEIESICNLKTNTGMWNSGNMNSGYSNSGYSNSGYSNSGNSNSGDSNSGYSNSGDWNSGYRNSGNMNSGDWNSGNWNSGYRNSGYRNSGDSNSGYRNSGDSNSGNLNSGNWNSGDRNSGNYNSGNYNSGDCNVNSLKVRLFDNDSNWDYLDNNHSKFRSIIEKYLKPLCEWISDINMSDLEKKDNLSYKTTGGYLKVNDNCRNDTEISKEDEEFLRSVPNFDEEKFLKCTGIDLKNPKVKIVIDGKEIFISKESAQELKKQL